MSIIGRSAARLHRLSTGHRTLRRRRPAGRGRTRQCMVARLPAAVRHRTPERPTDCRLGRRHRRSLPAHPLREREDSLEALPVWCHARGVRYDDGLYLPTRSQPLTDATSGATPRGAFVIGFSSDSLPQRFVIRAEVNHSTDFNDAYPKEAEPGSPGWSGGAMGSGQPALVWAATVDLTSRDSCWQARPIGHSSPDGTDGRIDPDLSQLTSALRIVHRIAVCRH